MKLIWCNHVGLTLHSMQSHFPFCHLPFTTCQ
jgi:hypothetical protein